MSLWDKILQHAERRVNPHSFATWFRPTRQERAEDDRLVIRVPTRLFCKRLTETYGELLQAVLVEVGRPGMALQFVCAEAEPVAANPAAAAQTKLDFDSSDTHLNPRYTFDKFIVGSSNQFAHAAAIAVAEQPSKSYNPLFLYGGVGLGKTHLMQAIGHALKRRNPALRLTYISAEKFTNEVIASIRFERMAGFRDRFRNMDVLMVDDIQFIARAERTQEEFFHTFNALYDQQKQIVISSDCPPKEISAIEERLRSRFEWGLIADIQPPDLETKIAILQKKADSEHVHMPDDVAEFIARSIKSNIRELEGALIRLMAYASLTGIEINLSNCPAGAEKYHRDAGKEGDHRADSKAGGRALRPARSGPEDPQQLEGHCLPAAGCHVPGEATHLRFAAGDWQAVRRQAPYDRAALHQQDREPPPDRQGFEQDDQQATRFIWLGLSVREGLASDCACG